MVRRAADGIRDLIERTGGRKVETRILVDQAYAHDQHENLVYKHPRGGQAKYLEVPLYTHAAEMLQDYADRLLHSESGARTWHDVMGGTMQQLVYEYAPVMFGDLRQSAAATTKEGGSVIAKSPATQRRLSPAQLQAKDHMRGQHGWDGGGANEVV